MSQSIHISSHPLVKHKLSILRDKDTPSHIFREVLHQISTIIFIEASSDLKLKKSSVLTPLQKADTQILNDRIGIVPILRAGLAMSDPISKILPEVSIWHLGLFRSEKTLKPVMYYNKLPQQTMIDVCYILDPMLATGGSAVKTIEIIKDWGVKNIRFISIIASPQGIANISDNHPDVNVYTASLDKELTKDHKKWPDGYILPGLGDAGDRLNGTL